MHHYNPNEIKKNTNHSKTFSVSQSCVKFKISKTKNLNIFLQLIHGLVLNLKLVTRGCQALLSLAETLDIKSLDLLDLFCVK